ncbi:isoaspartyl peptidase/L-asparaginase family protein [Vibrio renipiscarius]|uniref:Isoaspartyl peptidase n=1 Tax=Vibrio renipiscarius TaxID=1461322 RepID=A0A0C2NN44_9VIBR|nr:isoaspartyl peptidase/L-asparaginase [Vibrio renipiscarius]KII77690.1 peptidase [Vibrio renipiscarius]
MTFPFSIAVHGGPLTSAAEPLSAERDADLRATLARSVTVGHQILASGGDALDAVVASVKVLEDSEYFNAGRGSVLNAKEMVEMDASVMEGKLKQVGSVAGIRHIKNPIELAREVMLFSGHSLLAGDGAEAFAFERGYEFSEQDYFFTDHRYDQLMRLKFAAKGSPTDLDLLALSECDLAEEGKADDPVYGSVGAVALDQHGNLAAATSSGGVANQRFGRIGDSVMMGAGMLAENDLVAISSAGPSELLIRHRVASEIAARTRYFNEGAKTASDFVVSRVLKGPESDGGVIAIDHLGEIHSTLSGAGLYRASVDIQGKLSIKLFANE